MKFTCAILGTYIHHFCIWMNDIFCQKMYFHKLNNSIYCKKIWKTFPSKRVCLCVCVYAVQRGKGVGWVHFYTLSISTRALYNICIDKIVVVVGLFHFVYNLYNIFPSICTWICRCVRTYIYESVCSIMMRCLILLMIYFRVLFYVNFWCFADWMLVGERGILYTCIIQHRYIHYSLPTSV